MRCTIRQLVLVSLLMPISGALCIGSANPALPPNVWTNISPTTVAWQYLGTGNCFTQSMAIDPNDASTIYLCIQDFDTPNVSGGLYKTTDGGSTWGRLGPMDQGENIRVDPSNANHLYAADIGTGSGSHSGLWVTTDGGQNWAFPAGFTAIFNSTVHTTDVYHVDVDPTNFSHLLVSFHSGWNGGTAGVIESQDAGATFVAHQPDPGMANGGGTDVLMLYYPPLNLGNGQTWLFGIQGGGGFWRTTNSGSNWTEATTNGMDHGGAQLYYTKAGVLFCTGNPYLMKSTNNGVSWQTVGPSGAYLGICGDGTNLWALSHGGGSFITSPETDGVNWTTYGNQSFPAGGAFNFAFDSVNSIMYCAATGSGLLALRVNQSNTGITLTNATANPSSTMDNTSTTVTFSVDAAAQGSITSVTIDVRPIGGGAAVSMSKTSGNTYSATFTVQAGATIGDKVLLVKATNNSGQSLYASLAFTVLDHTAPVLVSRNKTVVASSVQNTTVPADAAVDGDLNTRWGSAFSDPQWIYVDLGSSMTVSQVVLHWESYAVSYQMQVSNDASTWNTVFSTTTGNGGIDSISFTPTSGRYVRMYGTQRGTSYGYSLYEFEVFSPATGSTVIKPMTAVQKSASAKKPALAFAQISQMKKAGLFYDVKGERITVNRMGRQAVIVTGP